MVVEPKAEKKDAKKKKEPVTLIDGKRAQNINILLGSKLAKLTFDDIKKAILSLDESLLPPEVVKLLVAYVPTEEEVRLRPYLYLYIYSFSLVRLSHVLGTDQHHQRVRGQQRREARGGPAAARQGRAVPARGTSLKKNKIRHRLG